MKVYCISLVRNVFLGIYSDYNEVDGVDMYYKFTAPDLVYSAFQHDFGPYDLGCVYRLCSELSEGMMYNMGEPMMFLIGDSPKEKTNGITVMCLAMMWGFGMSPDDVFRPFVDLELLPFRDVCKGNSTMELSVMDVLNGFHKALKLGWHDISNFDEVEYEKMGKPRHGNMNWIVPGKFLAMATPMDEDFPEKENIDGYFVMPSKILGYLKKHRVTNVIRLCGEEFYDPASFTAHGIKHTDLQFTDGTVPPDGFTETFLRVVAEAPGAVAVHCMQGVGRTGTLICCYLIKHHGFTAKESIGYARVCRPGSVMGPQQQFLIDYEAKINNNLFLPNLNKDA